MCFSLKWFTCLFTLQSVKFKYSTTQANTPEVICFSEAPLPLVYQWDLRISLDTQLRRSALSQPIPRLWRPTDRSVKLDRSLLREPANCMHAHRNKYQIRAMWWHGHIFSSLYASERQQSQEKKPATLGATTGFYLDCIRHSAARLQNLEIIFGRHYI